MPGPHERPGSESDVAHLTSLRGIYEPIQSELERVEKVLRDELSSDNPFVAALIQHSNRFAGKRVRPAMLLYCAHICGGVTDTHVALGAVVEMLHCATLVHDDVLDEADLRRQVKTLNSVWGNEASILFGDYLFAKAFTLCARLGSHEANVILARTTQEMCVGELSQISTKFDFSMDETQYEEIIRLKTAVLFATACRLGSVSWEADRELVDALGRYGGHFGIAFQIEDDILDLTGDEREVGKSLGTDLDKGKLTLPVIRLLSQAPERERKRLQQMLASTDPAIDRRREIVQLILERDVMSYCQARAQHHLDQAKRSLSEIKDLSAESLIALAEYSLKRRA